MSSDNTSPPPDRATAPDEDESALEPTDNPLAGGLNISVSVPESVEIKMVDASTLHDYEVWVFIVSTLASALVGFIVAAAQSWEAKSAAASAWIWMSVVLSILLVVAAVNMTRQRKRLNKRSKSVTLRVVAAEQRVKRRKADST